MQNINIKNSQDAIKAYSDSANAYSGTKMKTASGDQLDAFRLALALGADQIENLRISFHNMC